MRIDKHLREERIKSIVNKDLFTFPISGLGISKKLKSFQELKLSVKNFILKNLKFSFPDKDFKSSTDFLNKYYKDILNLPNKTPNGLLLFQNETQNEYNEMHYNFSNFVKNYINLDHISKIHIPLNLRISSGLSSNIDKRPRASSKWHIDVWAGEPVDSFIMFLPILGSCEASTVRYVDTNLDIKMLKEIDDYSSSNINKFDEQKFVELKDNTFVVSDSLVFHQTLRKQEKLRVSIDCRGIFKKRFKYENIKYDARSINYFDSNVWMSINKTLYLNTKFSFSNLSERIKQSSKKEIDTSYPLKFNLQSYK